MFEKKEVLNFIDKFKENTMILEQPMISWIGDGAYTLPEARKMVENDFLPEGIVVCAKRQNEEYWDSVFIFKNEDGYIISTNDMSGLPDRDATNVEEALKEASLLLKEYISLS